MPHCRRLRSGAGTDTITLSGTTGSATLASNIYKTEFVNVTGGNWTLDGVISDNAAVTVSGGVATLTAVNTYTGGTNVNGGMLLVNGTIVGDATVASGGTLGGSGYVGNLTNNGTVAPGSAAGTIGTLTATGNYTQNAGSTLNIQINDSGNCDKINARTATINGGTVAVAAASGTYHNGDTYRFLTATNGVSGRFTSVTDDLAFFDVSLLYGVDYVSLLLTAARNYVDEARTFNQSR